MEYKVDNAELTATLTAVNLDAAVIGQAALEVAIGESARIDVGTAVNYIKSGAAEIEAAVQEGTAAFDLHANEKRADFNENASNKTETFNTNASDKTAAYNQNAATQTTAFNENAAIKQAAVDASADAAAASATTAQQYAIGQPSEPSGYSAKYWAEQTAQSLSGLQSDVADIQAVIPASATASNKLTDKSYVDTELTAKQNMLISGTNIKTINGQSVLGGGNLNITAATSWGNITGTLSAQTDLQNALNTKQDVINDLSTIRSGAALGATAVQPADLATVATSGSYNDLSNKPTIPAAQVNSDWNASSGVAQILNKPSIPTDTADLTNGAGYITSSALANYVDKSTNQTIGGVKTFSSTISGSINGNAATVTNGVYTDTNQTISGQKTFTAVPIVYTDNPYIVFASSNLTKGTNPSSTVSGVIALTGSNKSTASAASLARLWLNVTADGTTCAELRAYKNESGSTAAKISIYYPTSGSAYVETTAYLRPSSDNSLNLGYTNYRWKQLYAGTTTISTSDERLKQGIENVPDAVLEAWGEVGFYRYKFNDSVAEKGFDKARYHTGMVAQRIENTFRAHGLNAFDYGLLCFDEWAAEPEVRDEENEIIKPAVAAGDRYSLRYEECLCMEAAYQRRRADRIEARLAALEARL